MGLKIYTIICNFFSLIFYRWTDEQTYRRLALLYRFYFSLRFLLILFKLVHAHLESYFKISNPVWLIHLIDFSWLLIDDWLIWMNQSEARKDQSNESIKTDCSFEDTAILELHDLNFVFELPFKKKIKLSQWTQNNIFSFWNRFHSHKFSYGWNSFVIYFLFTFMTI